MNYHCEILQQAAQPVLSIRTRAAVGDLPQVLGRAFGAIMHYLGELGQSPIGAPFTAYYNMDMQDLDIEIGFPVAQALPGRGEIQPGEIPGGHLGTTLHIGPYDAIAPAYEALTQFVQAQGYAPSGAAYEFYFSEPTVPPDQIQTQVMFPLQVLAQPA